tara:strand:+ start:306 stop:617 length:312 start_codon:yes stop_codon:yes gene_type:complete
MRTIGITFVMTSLIAIYTSSHLDSQNLAKISFFIPQLNNSNIEKNIASEVNLLNGVEQKNTNIETGTLEMIIDYNLFSLEDFKTSFDKYGWSYENPIVEDVYH